MVTLSAMTPKTRITLGVMNVSKMSFAEVKYENNVRVTTKITEPEHVMWSVLVESPKIINSSLLVYFVRMKMLFICMHCTLLCQTIFDI